MELVTKPEEDRAYFVRSNERRSNTTIRLTINQIIRKMEDTADLDYRGVLPDNALPIFNRLHDDDKKTFLRHALALLWERQIELSQRGIRDIIIDDVLIDLQAVETERTKIEVSSEAESIKMKNFLVRVTFVFSMTFVLVIFGSTFVYDPEKRNLIDFIGVFKSLLSLFG